LYPDDHLSDDDVLLRRGDVIRDDYTAPPSVPTTTLEKRFDGDL
jgi:hypothetical protein